MEVVVLVKGSDSRLKLNVQQGDVDYDTTIPPGGQLTLQAEPTPIITFA